MYIGVDFGGTNIRAAVMDSDGKIYKKDRIRTQATDSTEILIKRFSDFLNQFINHYEIQGIGIGFPGTVDNNGKIVVAPNLGWENIELKKELEERFKIPVIIDNDVNMAARGEKWMGAAKDFTDFFMATVGTGVGGAFFVNNSLYSGRNNNTGEIGHLNIYPDGMKCGCGKKGCLEQYASATALINYAKDRLFKYPDSELNNHLKDVIEAQEIFDAAKNGDELSLMAVNNMCFELTRGLSAVIALMNPQAIIIGGGVSHAGDFFINKIYDFLKKGALEYSFEGIQIKLAELGDQAGIFGAVYSFLNK